MPRSGLFAHSSCSLSRPAIAHIVTRILEASVFDDCSCILDQARLSDQFTGRQSSQALLTAQAKDSWYERLEELTSAQVDSVARKRQGPLLRQLHCPRTR